MIYQEWEKFEGGKVVATSEFSDEFYKFTPKGSVVLDLGCGDGRISKQLKDHGYVMYGMDINPEAIAFAQNDPNLSDIEFSVQNAAETKYENEFFDGVVEQAVLACVEKPYRSKVMAEVNRILKPGGIFSMCEFGIRESRTEKYKADALITGEYGTMIVRNEDGSEWFRSHNFTKDELDALIADSGFDIVSYASPVFKTFHGNSHPAHQYVVRKR